ncbi:MAG: mobile mystery protein B [Deltaproteobacteria bacterium]|nr:mobile mystery protein B [Deltaproteobacteria bacterium]
MDFKYPEGATPIEPDEAEGGLLLTHITTHGELNRWEQDNIVEALAWIDKTKPTNILNEQFIKQLHKRMFGNVWRWAGQFRRSDKNIGVSWHQVPMCLKNMFDDVPVWIQTQNESPEEMAVHFHHRLVWIHPFPNGNGRHARLMADIFIENVLHGSPFTWGKRDRDLLSPNEYRSRYIAALQEADNGNYIPLLEFAKS